MRRFPAVILLAAIALLAACASKSKPASVEPVLTPPAQSSTVLATLTSSPAHTATLTSSPVPSPSSTRRPTPPSTSQPASVRFVQVSGARQGGNASVTVEAPPNAQCDLTYRTPAGMISAAQ